jgi:hypothetical protein
MCVDSGCKCNIIDEVTYQKIKQKTTYNVKLHNTDINLRPYLSHDPLPIIGVFQAAVHANAQEVDADIYFVKGKATGLLGQYTSRALNLLHINTVHSINDDIINQYPEVFKGVGKLKDVTVKLHINEQVAPVAQTHRKIPFQLRDKIEKQLRELQDQDIIEDATGPTPWVSPLIAVPKPKSQDDIRLCVDMRAANEAIIRERHDTPTMDEIVAELNGSKYFSKLDLRSGYHQLELSPESRYITTFATHVGLKRYKRLNFGISSASEVFQDAIRQSLEGIPGVLNISDDILLHAPTQVEHDKRLKQLMQRLRETGLTLNGDKCAFSKRNLEFFGLIFGDHGVSPDPKKVESLKNAPPPQSAAEISSLLGMATFSARFIPDMATITEPLRRLTNKNTPFIWTEEQEEAMQKLQNALSSDTVMSYYDTNRDTYIWVDASPVGVGAILVQLDEDGNRKNVCYVSRSLKPTETRYSQIEREALAIV